MSIASGYSSASRTGSGGSQRKVYFELHERVNVDAGERLDGSQGMEKLKQTSQETGDQTYQRIMNTVGVAKGLGGFLPVRYYLHEAQEGYGRMKCEVMVDGVSVMPYVHMMREVRAHLAEKYYWDVDMVNCQPSLLKQVLDKAGPQPIPCPLLARYVCNREACLKEVVESCKVSRDDAKKLFIRVIYHGTVDAWTRESCSQRQLQPPLWIHELQKEVRENNKLLLLRPEFDDLKRYYKRKSLSVANDTHAEDGTATLIALHLQTLECECVRALVDAAQNDQRMIGGIVYDGIHVMKDPKESLLPTSMLERWEYSVRAKTGYDVKLSVKAFSCDPDWLRSTSSAPDIWDERWMNGYSLWTYEEMKVL